MPASTSSKTSVRACLAGTVTRRNASIVRASSPPEATLASGERRRPGVGGEQELDDVVSRVVADARRSGGRWAWPDPAGGVAAASASAGAAAPAGAATLAAARPAPSRRRRAALGVELGARSSWALQLGEARAAVSARKSRTSARVSPYLRRSSRSSWRRSRTAASALGSWLDRLGHVPQLGHHVVELGVQRRRGGRPTRRNGGRSGERRSARPRPRPGPRRRPRAARGRRLRPSRWADGVGERSSSASSCRRPRRGR